jgi:glycosyltransferase involved in cell wall biosynthesis
MNLSIIIPCLNAEATIANQLEALANQHWSKPWEVIVSDNGSTDSSAEIARKYRDHFPAFRIINSSGRKGASFARNAGVRVARGEAVAFCDADDEVAPGWVAAMGEALLQHDVVYGQMCFDKFNRPEQAKVSASRWKDGLYKEQFLPHAGAGNLGVKRSVHEAIGCFDECLPRSEDADYYWRLQLEGYKLHYVPKAIYQYRIGRVNLSLAYLYNRNRTAGASDYWLYKKYRSLGIKKDMILPPRRYLRQSLKTWLRILIKGPYACASSKETRVAWIRHFVMQTGEVVGELQGVLTNPCKPFSPVGNCSLQKPLNLPGINNLF